MARAPRRDAGSMTLEIAVLAPVLLLVVLSIVQVGLWSYARSLALGAAQEGATGGRTLGSSAGTARTHAQAFLDRAAGDSLLGTSVTVRRSASTVEVRVTGRALSVLPGVPGLPVRQHAVAPVERVMLP